MYKTKRDRRFERQKLFLTRLKTTNKTKQKQKQKQKQTKQGTQSAGSISCCDGREASDKHETMIFLQLKCEIPVQN